MKSYACVDLNQKAVPVCDYRESTFSHMAWFSLRHRPILAYD